MRTIHRRALWIHHDLPVQAVALFPVVREIRLQCTGGYGERACVAGRSGRDRGEGGDIHREHVYLRYWNPIHSQSRQGWAACSHLCQACVNRVYSPAPLVNIVADCTRYLRQASAYLSNGVGSELPAALVFELSQAPTAIRYSNHPIVGDIATP